MYSYKIDFGSLEWESPMPGIRHKVVQHGSKKIRLVEFSREMGPHWCEKAHYGYILEGTFEIEFMDGKRVFKASDGLFIPASTEHKHRAKVLTETVRALFVEDE